MSFDPLKITIHLDGTGVHFDPNEPLHFDGILAALLVRHHFHGEPPSRDERPDDVPIPCERWHAMGTWGWRCSALFVDGPTADGLIYWRKRFREHRAHLIESASPNLTNATYRAWNMPVPLILCREMVTYAVGDRRNILRALGDLKYIGKKRAHGIGAVTGVEVERIPEDLSLISSTGLAQRFLPSPDGQVLRRPRPPYWSTWDRVASVEVGDMAPEWTRR
jgi:hypothetical protein